MTENIHRAVHRASSVNQHIHHETGDGASHHSYADEEKQAFALHINLCLGNVAMLARVLPLDVESDDLFTHVNDGLLLAHLINTAIPDTVDIRSMNTKANLNVYQKTENLNKVVAAAKQIGCHVSYLLLLLDNRSL